MRFRPTSALAVVVALGAAFAVALPIGAQRQANERLDFDAIYRLKEEGLQRSQVMDVESYLTDVYGPRLTGSPNIKEAAEWAAGKMTGWGLANVHTEAFPFGRGWQNQRFVALALTPRAYPLIAYPKAWTPGTNGPVTGEAVMAIVQNDQDIDKFRGKLRGKFVLAVPLAAVQVQAHFDPQGRRLSDSDLAALSMQPQARGRGNGPGNAANQAAFNRRRTQFWIDERVAAVLDAGLPGDGGTVFVQAGGSRNASDPAAPAQVTLAAEHYGRIARTLEKNIPVTLQMDIDNRFYDADLNAFNIIGELPGTDMSV